MSKGRIILNSFCLNRNRTKVKGREYDSYRILVYIPKDRVKEFENSRYIALMVDTTYEAISHLVKELRKTVDELRREIVESENKKDPKIMEKIMKLTQISYDLCDLVLVE